MAPLRRINQADAAALRLRLEDIARAVGHIDYQARTLVSFLDFRAGAASSARTLKIDMDRGGHPVKTLEALVSEAWDELYEVLIPCAVHGLGVPMLWRPRDVVPVSCVCQDCMDRVEGLLAEEER